MPNIVAAAIFAVIDPLLAVPATFTTQVVDYYAKITKPVQKAEPDLTFSECRLRLDNTNPTTITLSDSRKISYALFGSTSSTARTVFFMHGWPGSRVEATHLDKTGQTLDLRIVSLDRPGYGSSTPDPKRTILSLADDVEQLAQHLNAEEYGVLGVSGGGPYALACAKALPAHKLKTVSIVCGLGPSDIGYRGMFLLNYLGWTYSSQYTPRSLRWWFSREPTARLDLSNKERLELVIKSFEKSSAKMNPKDARLFGDLDNMKVNLRTGMEANAQGSKWWMQDMKLLASDLGFKVEDIRKDLKVQLWYGRIDGNVPLSHGQEVARRLKTEEEIKNEDNSRVHLRIKDEETHASIFWDYRDEFMTELAKAM